MKQRKWGRRPDYWRDRANEKGRAAITHAASSSPGSPKMSIPSRIAKSSMALARS
jgi:hypothetical protein